MIVQSPQVHLWTREEYYRMAGAGLLPDRHVELLEGVILEKGPIRAEHSTAVGLTEDALAGIAAAGYSLRIQQPLSLGLFSEPEPDLAVVLGGRREYRDAHPRTAALIIEVADSSLGYDRGAKASLYAKAGIADYWILNLIDRRLEVFRDPSSDPSAPYGFGYASVRYFTAGAAVSPLAFPGTKIAVSTILP